MGYFRKVTAEENKTDQWVSRVASQKCSSKKQLEIRILILITNCITIIVPSA